MDSNTIAPVGQPADLATLAGQINEEHRAATDAAESALEHARRAGELLSEAKAACCHGEWLGWLESNFEGSTRTAQAYMRVASQWTEIQAKAQTSAHLSIDRALKLTAEPKPDTTTRDYFAGVDEDFAAIIPEPSPDRMLRGMDEHDQSYMVEVHPSREHVGFYHLLVYQNLDGLDGPDGWVYFDSRPCKYTPSMLALILDKCPMLRPTIWDSERAKKEVPWMIETGVERLDRLCRRSLKRGRTAEAQEGFNEAILDDWNFDVEEA